MTKFEHLHSSWLRARSAVNARTHDDSDVATDRLCSELYDTEHALLQASAPSKDSLTHKFEFLEIAIESSCDGDIMKAIGSIKRDRRGFGVRPAIIELPTSERRAASGRPSSVDQASTTIVVRPRV